jgi:hypothetical protein
MNGARGYQGSPTFDPATMGVWINGTMLPPNGWNSYGTWGSSPAETRMVDDGTIGDLAAGDNIYTWQTMLPAGSKATLEYKYGIDSQDNEAPANANHIRYVRGTNTFVLPVDTFGVQTQEPLWGDLKIAKAANSVTLSWLGWAGVRLQSTPMIGAVWTDVPGTLQANSATLPVTGTQMFLRLYRP